MNRMTGWSVRNSACREPRDWLVSRGGVLKESGSFTLDGGRLSTQGSLSVFPFFLSDFLLVSYLPAVQNSNTPRLPRICLPMRRPLVFSSSPVTCTCLSFFLDRFLPSFAFCSRTPSSCLHSREDFKHPSASLITQLPFVSSFLPPSFFLSAFLLLTTSCLGSFSSRLRDSLFLQPLHWKNKRPGS